MGEVIVLNNRHRDRRRYQKKLAEVREGLWQRAEELHQSCLSLAMLGAWREWDEQTPVGEEVFFSEEALTQTSDKNVTGLMNLYVVLVDTIEWLNSGAGSATGDQGAEVVGRIGGEQSEDLDHRIRRMEANDEAHH